MIINSLIIIQDHMNKNIAILFGLPKSIYLCLKSMPFKEAMHIPIFVSANTKLVSLKGRIKIDSPTLRPGMVRIGFGGAGTVRHVPVAVENNGLMILGEHVNLGGGTQICTVDKQSRLIIGRNTSVTGDSHIIAKELVKIGNDCLISWEVQIMDTDFHKLLNQDTVINMDQPVQVESNTWICSRATVLKGTQIAQGSVIASNALVVGKLTEKNCVWTGMPLKIIRDSAHWVL